MAAVYAAVVNGDTGTTASTVDYTKSGFGTPKAAIVLCARAETYDTAIANGAFSVGFWDSTDQVCYSCFAEGSGSTGDATDFGYNNKIMAIDNVDSSLQFSATVANITDGIRITYSANRSAAYKVTVILLNGADLQAKVGALALGTGTSPIEVSCGFQPDCILGLAAGSNDGTHRSVYLYPSFGCARDAGGGSTTHRCISMFQDNATTIKNFTVVRTDCLIEKVGWAARDWYLTASGWDSNGLDVTPSASTGSSYLMYLALDVGSASTWLGTVSPPTTASGAWDSPNTGFTPQLVILGQTLCDAVDSGDTSSPMADTFGICAFDGTTEGSIAITEDDGYSDAAAKSYASERLAYLYDGTYTSPTLYYDIGNATMDSTGWTVADDEVDTADSTTRYWWGFALQQGTQGVTVSNCTAIATAQVTSPSVVFGSAVVSGATATATVQITSPTVVYGNVTVSGMTIIATTDVTSPTVSIIVSNCTATATTSITSPTVVLGSITVSNCTATATTSITSPTVVLGSITVSNCTATATTSITSPTVVLGSITVSNCTATATTSITDPQVQTGGGITVSNCTATATTEITSPTCFYGAATVSNCTATSSAQVVSPTVSYGSVNAVPSLATGTAQVESPTVTLGGVTITGCQAVASVSISGPIAGVGNIVVSGCDPTVSVDIVSPTVLLGSLIVVPGTASVVSSITDPDLFLGSITINDIVSVCAVNILGPLLPGPLDPHRTHRIAYDERTHRIAYDERIHRITADTRMHRILPP